MAQVRPFSLPIISSARRAAGLVPSWVWLAMILVAVAGICSTVVLRSRAQMHASEAQYLRMSSDIDLMRRANAALEVEIRRMTTEPAMIESAARERLGMVKPTDIVVPIESRTGTNLATLSFVR